MGHGGVELGNEVGAGAHSIEVVLVPQILGGIESLHVNEVVLVGSGHSLAAVSLDLVVFDSLSQVLHAGLVVGARLSPLGDLVDALERIVVALHEPNRVGVLALTQHIY